MVQSLAPKWRRSALSLTIVKYQLYQFQQEENEIFFAVAGRFVVFGRIFTDTRKIEEPRSRTRFALSSSPVEVPAAEAGPCPGEPRSASGPGAQSGRPMALAPTIRSGLVLRASAAVHRSGQLHHRRIRRNGRPVRPVHVQHHVSQQPNHFGLR